MTMPLALLIYENLLPGSQLPNRLEQLGYRVQMVADAASFLESAEREKPMLVVMDLVSSKADMCALVSQLRANPATQHLPVLAYTDEQNAALQAQARQAGATLVASGTAFLSQLPHLLEQVLQVD
ncbi:MAG: response regulator [Verrucomicrobiota bacterium]